MTRKDFELIAKALEESNAPDSTVARVGQALATTNPRFDYLKFVEACKK